MSGQPLFSLARVFEKHLRHVIIVLFVVSIMCGCDALDDAVPVVKDANSTVDCTGELTSVSLDFQNTHQASLRAAESLRDPAASKSLQLTASVTAAQAEEPKEYVLTILGYSKDVNDNTSRLIELPIYSNQEESCTRNCGCGETELRLSKGQVESGRFDLNTVVSSTLFSTFFVNMHTVFNDGTRDVFLKTMATIPQEGTTIRINVATSLAIDLLGTIKQEGSKSELENELKMRTARNAVLQTTIEKLVAEATSLIRDDAVLDVVARTDALKALTTVKMAMNKDVLETLFVDESTQGNYFARHEDQARIDRLKNILNEIIVAESVDEVATAIDEIMTAVDAGKTAVDETTKTVAQVKASTYDANSLTRFGITWFFDRDYQTGTFANGDQWVVGPIKITKITPQSITGDRIMNGSMLDPAGSADGRQGYDTEMYGSFGADRYDSALNVALDVSDSNPLSIAVGHSLVSTISLEDVASLPQLDVAAILTILDSVPLEECFRPPYAMNDKKIRFNKADLNYDKLGNLAVVDDVLSLDSLAQSFENPWIDHARNWLGRFLHPKSNMPDYGKEIASLTGHAGLALMLNYTNLEKEKLLIRYVQFGIDTYGLAESGLIWSDDGGHMLERKLPLLFAGIVLDNQAMIDWADANKNFIFQEDRQTWFVTNADVTRKLDTSGSSPRETYLTEDVGIAEWGEKHTNQENRDDRRWTAKYRRINGSAMQAHILTARLLGAESMWNWPALFAYTDRYWQVERESVDAVHAIPQFTRNMWEKYASCAKDQCK